MDAHEYFEKAIRTIPAKLEPITSQRDLLLVMSCLGLYGEGGEFTDHIKKFLFHGHPLDRDYVIKELGDKLWYINSACLALGVSLSEIMAQNIEKLERRYPGGRFSVEASLNRKD